MRSVFTLRLNHGTKATVLRWWYVNGMRTFYDAYCMPVEMVKIYIYKWCAKALEIEEISKWIRP